MGYTQPARCSSCCIALLLTLLLFIGFSSSSFGTLQEDGNSDFENLTLEELMNIEVTSVSRKPENALQAASAISVITEEDIRRSGATSIPEILRMAPGIQVAEITNNMWAITSRGFSSVFSNKLLILIDGRSIYSPLFAGVYWDSQDTLLEDIARIEIIRGPGATLWGSNAVNGVINIITKNTRETQGGLISGGGGSEEQGFGGIRYGDRLGESAFWRVYAKGFNRNSAVYENGHDANDDWDLMRGGFRLDWDATDIDSITLQGDVYSGNAGQAIIGTQLLSPYRLMFIEDTDISGGNLLTRWCHSNSQDSGTELQLYYDRTKRDEKQHREVRDTFDIDFQHRFKMGIRHELSWGLGYRLTADDIRNSFTISFYPDDDVTHICSAFIQDRITLLEDRLQLTIGSKFEHNDYTGLEIQPNARLSWTPTEHQTIWATISRAMQTTVRSHEDIVMNVAAFPGAGGTVNLLSLRGGEDIESEELLAFELGYRNRLLEQLSLDTTVFYNIYDDLRTWEPQAPFFETSPIPHMVMSSLRDNKMYGESYGAEIALTWYAAENWRLTAAYTYFDLQLHLDSSSQSADSEEAEGSCPAHQAHLRSHLDLPHGFEIDAALYYVDNLSDMDVHQYTRFDARLGWHSSRRLEASLMLRNILDDRHPEMFSLSGVSATETEHDIYGKITWRF
jgi:iron complex outermembrane recepter protein